MTKLIMVEALSQYRMRYVMEVADDAPDFVATDRVKYGDAKEMSQLHLDEIVLSSREITKQEYLKLFDEDNDYLREWDNEKKFTLINNLTENK